MTLFSSLRCVALCELYYSLTLIGTIGLPVTGSFILLNPSGCEILSSNSSEASDCVGISIAVQLLLPCYVILILLNLFCIHLTCLKFAYFANVSFLLSILIIRCYLLLVSGA